MQGDLHGYDQFSPFYATVNSWIVSFKRGKCIIQEKQRSGRLICMSTPENMNAVHEMILSDQGIGLKYMDKTLDVSYERVHVDCVISVKWILKCLNAAQKRALIVETNQSFRTRLSPCMKHAYIFTTLKTSNRMEWKHSGFPRAKKFLVQKSPGKVFWNSHGAIVTKYFGKGIRIGRKVLHTKGV